MKLRSSLAIQNKIRQKHQVRLYEVAEAIRDPRRYTRRVEIEAEGTVYIIVGKTESGRLLRVVYIAKKNGNWLKTALDAYPRDRKMYNRK